MFKISNYCESFGMTRRISAANLFKQFAKVRQFHAPLNFESPFSFEFREVFTSFTDAKKYIACECTL